MQELTAIVGRQAEVAQITELLHVQRLVTLVGPGGIGKTRLARAVAASAADRFPGGVFVIELVGSTELGELASLVAGQLGFDSLEGVHYRSIDQAVLVVLDNCESAIHQSARLAADLGDRASALRVLATSRAPLGSPGEYLVPVRPLRVPAVGDLADARSCAAVQLFLERSARAGARLVASDAVVGQVAELVRRLDGMPLAIELAAARSRVLSPAQLLERLEGHLELLSRPGDGTDRHRSIRAAIRTSYGPLAAELQQFFRGLGVIAAPFDVGLAHAVRLDRSDVDEATTVELLAALIDASLLEPSQVGDGPVRYRLLEPVRLFARELSAEAGELDTATERYVDALVAWAMRFAVAALEGFRSEVMTGLHDNYAHLVHALDWCIARDATAARANRLFLPLFGHSRPETVARAKRIRTAWPDRAPLHAEVLAVMGAVAMHGGSPALAKQWSKEAIECAGRSDLAGMIAQRTLGYLAAYAAEPMHARVHLNDAAVIARRFSAAFAREIELSCVAATAGPADLDTALATTAEIARDAAASGEVVTVQWAAVVTAALFGLRGRYDDALEAAGQARALAERTGHVWSISAGHRSVASVVAARDGWVEAAPHFRLAFDASLAYGDLAGASVTLRTAAGARLRYGDVDGARRLWAAVVDPTARSIVVSLFAPEERELEARYGPTQGVDVAVAITEARESLGPPPGAATTPATQGEATVIHFGDHELDLGLCELRHLGARVHVEPQVFDVLVYLANRHGSLVTKEELLDNVWGSRFVSESALTTRIKAARRATGDNGEKQSVIRTVRGRGFTFVADVG